MTNDYSKKTVAELVYIQKDAYEAAQAIKGFDPKAEAKYLDQLNDACNELYKRRNAKPIKMSFRKLDAKETCKFAQWARDNYVVGSVIDPVWHPVVRAECELMNQK